MKQEIRITIATGDGEVLDTETVDVSAAVTVAAQGKSFEAIRRAVHEAWRTAGQLAQREAIAYARRIANELPAPVAREALPVDPLAIVNRCAEPEPVNLLWAAREIRTLVDYDFLDEAANALWLIVHPKGHHGLLPRFFDNIDADPESDALHLLFAIGGDLIPFLDEHKIGRIGSCVRGDSRAPAHWKRPAGFRGEQG